MEDQEGVALSAGRPEISLRLDTSVPHPARRYNYWLGGKNNFAADRESGDAIAAAFPTVRTAAAENRRFLRRVVAFLAEQVAIRQFLDIGPGLPSADNTHDVVRRLDPSSRVVYVDNDPLVTLHSHAFLAGAPDAGVTDYVEADVREPNKILREAARTLDFSQPVALMLVAILQFIPDGDDPFGIVGRLIDALPSGSYLVVSHPSREYVGEKLLADMDSGRHGPFRMRTREQFARFFDGLDLISPGIVSTAAWRAENEPQPRPTAAETATYGAVARIVR